MKIAQVVYRFNPAVGGVENLADLLARKLSRRGHDVTVITSDLLQLHPFRRVDKVAKEMDGISVRRYRAVKIVTLRHGLGIVPPRAFGSILRDDFDIVHAHSLGFWPTFLGLAYRFLRTRALVITPHSIPGARKLGAFDFRFTPLKHADAVVANTFLERGHLVENGVDPSRIEVISPGIETPVVQLPDYEPVHPVILFAGRLDFSQKGLDVLVQSIPRVLDNIPQAKFVFAGEDWGGMKPITDMAVKLGVVNNIEFTGRFEPDQWQQVFSRSNLVVLPSRGESFGITLLEAMATGRPTVATKVGAIPEVVRQGVEGILVSPERPRELSEAIVRILSNPDVFRSMAKNAIARAQYYSADAYADATEQLYSRLV